MEKEHFFAALVMRLLNLKFRAEQGHNPKMVSFQNERDNKIYMSIGEHSVEINVFKQTRSCFNGSIIEFSNEKIEMIISTVKSRLNLKVDLAEEI